MARIRSIHPGLFTDEDFVILSDSAQLFYIALLTEADDQGIFEWKPLTLKMRLRPASMQPVDPLLSELAAAKKIGVYEIDGRKYGAIRNFRRYQRPKSPNAIHPITDEWRKYVGLSDGISEMEPDEPPLIPPNREMQPDEPPPFLPNGEIAPQMEEEGKEKEVEKDGGGGGKGAGKGGVEGAAGAAPPRKRETRLAAEWVLPTEWREAAAEKRRKHSLPSLNLDLESEKFANHWWGQPGARGIKLDWRATWLKWCLTAEPPRNDGGQDPDHARAVIEAALAEEERSDARH